MFPSLRSMETQHSFCVPRVCAPKKHHEQKCVRNTLNAVIVKKQTIRGVSKHSCIREFLAYLYILFLYVINVKLR